MENDFDYSIEELSDIFLEHAEIFDKEAEKMRKNNPDAEFCLNGFNVARALAVMSWEIEKLKLML